MSRWQRDCDTCRRELKKLRQEMDELRGGQPPKGAKDKKAAEEKAEEKDRADTSI